MWLVATVLESTGFGVCLSQTTHSDRVHKLSPYLHTWNSSLPLEPPLTSEKRHRILSEPVAGTHSSRLCHIYHHRICAHLLLYITLRCLVKGLSFMRLFCIPFLSIFYVFLCKMLSVQNSVFLGNTVEVCNQCLSWQWWPAIVSGSMIPLKWVKQPTTEGMKRKESRDSAIWTHEGLPSRS